MVVSKAAPRRHLKGKHEQPNSPFAPAVGKGKDNTPSDRAGTSEHAFRSDGQTYENGKWLMVLLQACCFPSSC